MDGAGSRVAKCCPVSIRENKKAALSGGLMRTHLLLLTTAQQKGTQTENAEGNDAGFGNDSQVETGQANQVWRSDRKPAAGRIATQDCGYERVRGSNSATAGHCKCPSSNLTIIVIHQDW